MWFKNLQIYRFTRPFDLTVEQLETQLEAWPSPPAAARTSPGSGGSSPLANSAPP